MELRLDAGKHFGIRLKYLNNLTVASSNGTSISENVGCPFGMIRPKMRSSEKRNSNRTKCDSLSALSGAGSCSAESLLDEQATKAVNYLNNISIDL
jgi:hypothetical protein